MLVTVSECERCRCIVNSEGNLGKMVMLVSLCGEHCLVSKKSLLSPLEVLVSL